jgi:hypothetical protein
MIDNSDVSHAMTVRLDTIFTELPPAPPFAPGVRRAPNFSMNCSPGGASTATGFGLPAG